MTPSRSLGVLHLLAVFICCTHVLVSGFLRVCYFTNWSKWKESPLAKFDVENIDPYICTHLIYAFAAISSTQRNIVPLDESDVEQYRSFNALKTRNSQLKTMLSIGGQHDKGKGFTAVSFTDSALSAFAANTVIFLRRHGFDGLDVDWEYPNRTTSGNFIRILNTLRSAFDNENTSSRLLLTIAAPGGQTEIDDGFNVPEIDKFVDYVNLMTYDYSIPEVEVTVFNSPLFSRDDVRFNPTLSTNWTVQYYRKLGLRPSKMLVGFTGVGRRLVLKDIAETDVGSPVTGEIRISPDYLVPAGLVYPEVCQMLQNSRSKRMFDSLQRMHYLVQGDNWVGYEDEDSLGVKTEWSVNNGVAGMMFWSLDQDDFNGVACNRGKFPLLSKIRSLTEVSDTTPTKPTLTTSTARTTASSTRAPSTTTTTFSSAATSTPTPKTQPDYNNNNSGSLTRGSICHLVTLAVTLVLFPMYASMFIDF
ncbi:hypothetical protein Btru_047192 [Bulinus truncatus]|nr:hypothetical protein Btru_047192 [Bulinus truncatus]